MRVSLTFHPCSRVANYTLKLTVNYRNYSRTHGHFSDILKAEELFKFISSLSAQVLQMILVWEIMDCSGYLTIFADSNLDNKVGCCQGGCVLPMAMFSSAFSPVCSSFLPMVVVHSSFDQLFSCLFASKCLYDCYLPIHWNFSRFLRIDDVLERSLVSHQGPLIPFQTSLAAS